MQGFVIRSTAPSDDVKRRDCLITMIAIVE
jgi:hypothetical protein